jgi:prefoldin subunit 5
LEIITLNGELRKLSSENQKLHSEVTALTGEVARLQAVLQQGAQNGRTS